MNQWRRHAIATVDVGFISVVKVCGASTDRGSSKVAPALECFVYQAKLYPTRPRDWTVSGLSTGKSHFFLRMSYHRSISGAVGAKEILQETFGRDGVKKLMKLLPWDRRKPANQPCVGISATSETMAEAGALSVIFDDFLPGV